MSEARAMLTPILTPIIAQLLHLALVLLVAPLLFAGTGWASGRLTGHRPPGPRAQVAAILRLVRAQPVLSEGASAVFRQAPLVRLAALLGASLLVPGFASGMALAPVGDLLLIAGLFALARGAEICAALDAGTAASGHAAALLLRRAFWLEPALVLAIFALAALADATSIGGSNLDIILGAMREAAAPMQAVVGLVVLSLGIAGLAENGRAPFSGADDLFGPDAWQAAYGGRDLVVIRLASALRLLVWLNLVADLLPPFTLVPANAVPDWPLGLAAWAIKLALLSAALVVAQAASARLRPGRESEWLCASVLLGLLALVVVLALAGRA